MNNNQLQQMIQQCKQQSINLTQLKLELQHLQQEQVDLTNKLNDLKNNNNANNDSSLDCLAQKSKWIETSFTNILKYLLNISDPLQFIDLAFKEYDDKLCKYEEENKLLKENIEDYRCEIDNLNQDNSKTQIHNLYEKIHLLTNDNLDLREKLKLSECEIDSLKKILNDYRSELSEMKLKNIQIIPTTTTNTNTTTSNNDTHLNTSNSNTLKNLLIKEQQSSSSTTIIKEEPNLINIPTTINEQPPTPHTPSLSPIPQIIINTDEVLNTFDIANKVRDLLAVHNIGQRVFAKNILNLSQGTVSELLSKPKHWDKLTEKGRESYRKMHQWSICDKSINALKAHSPRKLSGSLNSGNNHQYSLDSSNNANDSETQERIVQILNEAQKQMQNNHQLEQKSINNQNKSLSSNGSMISNGSCRADSTSSTLSSTTSSPPPPLPVTSDYYDECTDEALDLTCKQQTTNTNLITPTTISSQQQQQQQSSAVNLKREFNEISDNHLHHHHNQILQNECKKLMVNPFMQIETIAKHIYNHQKAFEQISVLNNIKNIQLLTPQLTPQMPNSTPTNTNNNNIKPLKSILPAVSQEQFDKYPNIVTEDLVKKVKDLLSKYSISQRLFGECILGLSQGSVSDLLARPKPWNMLTQKGREPFIRMQMFIEDPDSIKKLMANQYKVPVQHQQQQQQLQQQHLHHQSSFNNDRNYNKNNHDGDEYDLNTHSMIINKFHPNHHHHSNNNNNNLYQQALNIIPYDISSLSPNITDINTEEITNKVKETLLNNNIGQKLFGEAVLNLSQGTVSELLSKPKPWQTLSIKGREPYLRMYMWLQDDLRLEKLNEWKEEKNMLKRTATEVENDQQKPKRRFIFTEDQKEQLLVAFISDPYPSVTQMEQLADRLNLATRTVINWFHNHRMRIRYSKNSQLQAQLRYSSSSSSTHNQSNFKQQTNHHHNQHLQNMSRLINSHSQQDTSPNTNYKPNYMIDDDQQSTTYDDMDQNYSLNDYDDDVDDDCCLDDHQNSKQQQQDEMNSLFINEDDTNHQDLGGINGESGSDDDDNDDDDDDDDDYDDNYTNKNSPQSLNSKQLQQQIYDNSKNRRKPHNPQKISPNGKPVLQEQNS